MLVTMALIDADQGANVGGWRTLDGILTEVTSAGLSIGLNNLLDSFIGVTHTHRHASPEPITSPFP